MKILLINPPTCIDPGPRVVYFGIAYIFQELHRHRYDAALLDIDGNRYFEKEVTAYLEKTDADVIAIGGLATIYPYLHWLVPEIRRLRPKSRIILGGAIAASLRERCFTRFDIDFEVIGEGEVTIIELLKEISGGGNFASVRGIGFRHKGRIVFTEKRELMKSLDTVPVIDYTSFPIENYLRYTQGILPIHTQRGCPGSCTFCFNCYRVVGNAVRYRPVQNVIDEIELFKEKYNVKLFSLSGECIMFNKQWIIDFSREIVRRGLDICYRVNSRVDTVDEERLACLQKSGCTILSLGVESGSQKILNIMKKGVTVEQGKKAICLAKKYIPQVEYSIMFGYMGEDESTIRESVEFVKAVGVRIQIFYYATAFPGTPLYTMALRKGFIKNEESYLMDMDKSSVTDLARYVNLTDMPDTKLKGLILSAIREMKRYYFFKELLTMRFLRPDVLRRAFHYAREEGVFKTVGKIARSAGLKN